MYARDWQHYVIKADLYIKAKKIVMWHSTAIVHSTTIILVTTAHSTATLILNASPS